MKQTLILTPDHITLIKNLRFQQIDKDRYGVDVFSLWGGDYVYEDMAYLLGYENRVIRESQNDPFGPAYESDVQNYLEKLVNDFVEHLTEYEDILHQFCDKGGLKVGKYTKKANEVYWTYLGEDITEEIEKPLISDKDWDMLSSME